jgi:alanyl-tRNA synthetase
VGPDKLRFDFTHGASLSPDELRDVEDRVNEWIKASAPVRWLNMGRAEAEELGAMALFGEKYGEWVRVVEVDGVSRELCGGTHVANTAEIGIFKLTGEGSSAANVRRIEAITGPAAIDHFRGREAELREVGELLGTPQDPLVGARRAAERLAEAGAAGEKAQRAELGDEADRLSSAPDFVFELADGKVLVAEVKVGSGNQKQLLELANRLQSKLAGDSAVVLGGKSDDKVGLVALFSKGMVERGLSAGGVIREIAPVVGGGGGGRDDMAQAGGRDPSRLGEALAAARAALEAELS